jgi:ABC-type sugar transport system ATPase subunit
VDVVIVGQILEELQDACDELCVFRTGELIEQVDVVLYVEVGADELDSCFVDCKPRKPTEVR